MVTIRDKSFNEGSWYLDVVIDLADGTRIGPHSVEAPEDATDDELKALVLALYGIL